MMNTESWLKALIAFDTTSRNSNKALIEYVANALNSPKISCRTTFDETGTKANLFVTLSPDNGQMHDGLVLSGHTDVVPVDGQAWNTPPFTATKIEDRIYGRGACDMKGFLAVILSLVPRFLQLSLKRPLHFAFSYDEEVGCLGAPLMIQDFQSQGIHPSACIVGEPTLMKPVVAHKGIQVYTCRVHGMAAHSSLTPKACNAIEHAAALVHAIRGLAESLKEKENDLAFDVPFTTLTNNLISGGTAGNIVPEKCEFTFEFRHLPTVDPETITHQIKALAARVLPKMQQECPDARIEFIKKGGVPAFEAKENEKITQLVSELHEDKHIHKVSYATEAGIFQGHRIPTVLCGPGSIEEAHRPNEFVALTQLDRCEHFLYELVGRYCCNS